MKTKKPLTRKRKPSPASLAWYHAEWSKALGPRASQDAVKELARLSYENKQIRRRLEAVEKVILAMTLGMVEVDGARHLMHCAVRDGKSCSCGAVGDKEVNRN